jgi:dihydroorotate dehydrogenase (fumarate)
MPDLRTRYLGLDLPTPIVASASPGTANIDALLALEKAGAGAVVLPSLFEEQIARESAEDARSWWSGLSHGSAVLGAAVDLDAYNAGTAESLHLVRRARSRLRIPVIASLACRTPAGWLQYAKLAAEAGAHALELNLYALGADPRRPAAEIERAYTGVVTAVAEATGIGVSVKIADEFTSLGHTVRALADAGAGAVVLFNRRQVVDVDLDHLVAIHTVRLSDRAEVGNVLRALWALAERVSVDLAASTGIATGDDAARAIACGASAVYVAAAILRDGPAVVAEIGRGLDARLTALGIDGVAALRGRVALPAADDPAAADRLGYIDAMLRTAASTSTAERPIPSG